MNNSKTIDLIYDLNIGEEKRDRIIMHKVVNYFIDGDFLPEKFQNFEKWSTAKLKQELKKLNWDDLYTRLSLQETLDFDSAPLFWTDLLNRKCQDTNQTN
jgi:hypothetical protein